MAQRKFHVSEALERNKTEVNALIYGGYRQDFAEMKDIKLTEPVIMRHTPYTHATINRYQSSDFYEMPRPGETALFAPRLSMLFHVAPGLEDGLVTHINYAAFGLSEPYLNQNENMPEIPGLLRPTDFSFYRGEIFDEPTWAEDSTGFYVAGNLGTAAESGMYPRVVGEAVEAIANTMRTVGTTALFDLHGYNEPN